jgi:alkanesulfonate monooxygenase SsuD/methylene tetrahydromethanopterin reductase-like flavin-dependent oxidoreductase (luciferase family)
MRADRRIRSAVPGSNAPPMPLPESCVDTLNYRKGSEMKLGMFMMPLHPVGRNYVEILREDREAILLADRLGYAEAFVGEHITDVAESITSCLMFLASVAHETTNIVLGSGTINLPNTHPATVAAQVAMLDNMLEGRFIMGISPGGLMSDVEVFGNLEKDRTEMFVEAIDMVLKIWQSQPPYNLVGKHFQVSTQRTMIPEIGQGEIVKPFQRPHPLIVGTAVAPYSKGVTALAERGWQTISANFLLPQWVATHWPKYVEGRKNVGAVADPSEWRIAKSIFVADDEATAQSYGRGPDGPYQFYFKQLIRKLVTGGGRSNLFKADQDMPDSEVTPAYATEKLVIAGTVQSVVDQILAFREQVGDFGTLLYACHDWVDPVLGKRSMQLMAEEVMPRVNAAIGKSSR